MTTIPTGRADPVRVVGVMSHLTFADTPASLRNPLRGRRFYGGASAAQAAGLRPVVVDAAVRA